MTNAEGRVTLREASRGGIADYSGITYDRLRREGGIHWPCPEPDHLGTGRLFADSFAHPDQKAALSVIPNDTAVPKEKPTADYPLYLTTGRVMAHYLTGVQTRKSAALAARHFESFMEIHPQTAASFQIEDRVLVKIESPRGSITVRSKLSDQIRKDTVFVPIHWADAQNVNDLIGETLDPACKMPGFKVCAVRIRPF